MLDNEAVQKKGCEVCGEPRPQESMRTCGKPECIEKAFAPRSDPSDYVKSEENHG